MELKGKTILITGGAAGIGLEATKQFLANGAKVIITGRNQAKLDAVKKSYPAITAIQSDVADANDAQLLFDKIKELGGIDILYNNAGVMSGPANLGVANDKHFEAAENEININYLGVIRLTNFFIEMLKSKKEAAIINTSSVLSYVPFNLAPTYSASKAAICFYTVSLRDHLQILNSRVKVFELLPPVVATSMTEGLEAKGIPPEKLINELIAGIKKNKFTIRVGDTKLVYLINRIAPKMAYGLINTAKNAKLLK
ncbi:MAG: SDR family NAD(P)-dependent oxidoreductase [Mucilaginibacter sp.]|uniref:SDR family oxidoreductase n=1 Tax=Mucilaginibacter sp. TaxID=1882438 RepID=UPI0032641AF1